MATKMIKLGLMFLLKIGNLALGKLEVAHWEYEVKYDVEIWFDRWKCKGDVEQIFLSWFVVLIKKLE